MNFRTKVFKNAHSIKKTTGQSLSSSLKKAWRLYRLTKVLLKNQTATFSYLKKDGSVREAVGTLQKIGEHIKGTGKTSSKVFRYWDLEANWFRCFNIENLISISN